MSFTIAVTVRAHIISLCNSSLHASDKDNSNVMKVDCINSHRVNMITENLFNKCCRVHSDF